jgi:hypothetical protein
VPGDGFAFPVRVRGYVNFLGIFGGLFQFFDDLLFPRDNNIIRVKLFSISMPISFTGRSLI